MTVIKPQDTIREVYLKPGDFCFGEGNLRITTVLGSCVSIILWHPMLVHGGMCHYMLPTRGMPHHVPNGKYGDEAMELFLGELRKRRTVPGQYQVWLYGGGNMFNMSGTGVDIGKLNIQTGHDLLNRHGFTLIEDHVGMTGRRRIAFDVWSGTVRMTHIDHLKTGVA